MTEQYLNQPAAEWARCKLARGIEIKLRGNSWPARIVVALAMLFLSVIFFGIPALLLINAAANFVAGGWSAKVSGPLRMGIFFLAGFGGLAVFLFFYVRTLRRKLVRLLSADGVTTRGGKTYRWENLQHLNYVRFYREMSRNVLLRVVSKFIFAGVETLKIEMVFTDGTATLAPLIENQREVLDLIDTIPARRTSEVRLR
ncbi:MAG TPA: hypothetical protein VF656_04850 [Pyrinomonadaceae bacterium]|jgi:hypothetical protein